MAVQGQQESPVGRHLGLLCVLSAPARTFLKEQLTQTLFKRAFSL